MDLTTFLLELYADLRLQRDRINTFLSSGECQMNQSTKDAIKKVGDAITAEIEEIRSIVNSGSDSTEVDTALETLATRISGISDSITAVESGNPDPNQPGSGDNTVITP